MRRLPGLGGERVAATAAPSPKQSFMEDVRALKERLDGTPDLDEQVKISAAAMPTILASALTAMEDSEAQTEAMRISRNRARIGGLATGAAVIALGVANVFGAVGGSGNQPKEAVAQSPSPNTPTQTTTTTTEAAPAAATTAPVATAAAKAKVTKNLEKPAPPSFSPFSLGEISKASKGTTKVELPGLPETESKMLANNRAFEAAMTKAGIEEFHKGPLFRAFGYNPGSQASIDQKLAEIFASPDYVTGQLTRSVNVINSNATEKGSIRNEFEQTLKPGRSVGGVEVTSLQTDKYGRLIAYIKAGSNKMVRASRNDVIVTVDTDGDKKADKLIDATNDLGYNTDNDPEPEVGRASWIKKNVKDFICKCECQKEKIIRKITRTPTPPSIITPPETTPKHPTPKHPKPKHPKPKHPKPKHPKPQPRPKHDKNNTPAGVPGHNGGTPDKPGKGPAGQKPDGSGFVPGEEHPATPAPAPTPAPLPNNPAPTGPAETGHDNGPNQAPTNSTNTGQTIPTSDPNPQG